MHLQESCFFVVLFLAIVFVFVLFCLLVVFLFFLFFIDWCLIEAK